VGTHSVTLRFLNATLLSLTMAFLDDAQHTGRNTYSVNDSKPWPRELLTLAWVCISVGFWAVLLLVTGTI